MTPTLPPPLRRQLPPPARPAPATPSATPGRLSFGPVTGKTGDRICLYGPGGIGKTTLAKAAPGPVVFFDLDRSLTKLGGDNVQVVNCAPTFAGVMGALNAPGWDAIRTIVIDTGTRLEQLAVEHTIATVKHEKGHTVNSIEGYGFGKGLQHVYETWMDLLQACDTHSDAGRNVVVICHDCTTPVPNPSGEDWLRYEPRLQSPSSGKASIRLATKERFDHMLFYGYDVSVKDGKAAAGSARTIYGAERPHCMAKGRNIPESIPIDSDAHETLTAVWSQIIR